MSRDRDDEDPNQMGNTANQRGLYGPIPDTKTTRDRDEPMDVRLSSEMGHSFQTSSQDVVCHSKWLFIIAGFALFMSTVVVVTYRSAINAAHSNDLRNHASKGNPLDDNPSAYPKDELSNRDPWNINSGYGGIFGPPSNFKWNDTDSKSWNAQVGYFTHPDVHDDTLVFIAEGDIYATRLNNYDGVGPLSAMRITQTEGNVLTPKIAPCGYLVAYTATYTGIRDVYIADLRGNTPAYRVTFMDSDYGALFVTQWISNDEVEFSAYSSEAAMDEVRLYRVKVSGDDVGAVTPVPLAQANDASNANVDDKNCTFFVRYKQSSSTIRYIGGTAENIWSWCGVDDVTTKLSGDYKGSSRSPRYVSRDGNNYLLFLSDRSDGGLEPSPLITNLFAQPLDNNLNPIDAGPSEPFIQLTNVCGGIGIADFSVDSITGNVIVRIGADLYYLKSSELPFSSKSVIDLASLEPMALHVHSDFNKLQERVIPAILSKHLTGFDAIHTASGQAQSLLTLRGQLFRVPIAHPPVSPYQIRRQKLAPGSRMGGSTRVLWSGFVDIDNALVLATDPLNTASHSWYIVSTHEPSFSVENPAPTPILTNITSIYVDTISTTMNRVAWVDTNMDIHFLHYSDPENIVHVILPKVNDQGNPVANVEGLEFHVSGDLLAIRHSAKNQFTVITIAQFSMTGNELSSKLIQATSDQYNCFGVYFALNTMYFFSDRDITTDVSSPWGTRSPMPHWKISLNVYALPLSTDLPAPIQIPELNSNNNFSSILESALSNETFVPDLSDLIYRAYRLDYIPGGFYYSILSADTDYIVLLRIVGTKPEIVAYASTGTNGIPKEVPLVEVDALESIGVTNNRQFFYMIVNEELLVVENTLSGLTSLKEGDVGQAFTEKLSLQISPQVEYASMYDDAWRLLRDYFYDKNMHGLDWRGIHSRYAPLVSRCTKREDLDDVLKYMASELSALHVFIYGGEYSSPIPMLDGTIELQSIASLGATLTRTELGYSVSDILIPDPNFDLIDGNSIVSPLLTKTLRLTGQRGVDEGDIITHINGEHVLGVPSIGYLLRGLSGLSIQLSVQRKASSKNENIIVVPITQDQASDLRYRAWEYKTKQEAIRLASEANFTVGYLHLRSMGDSDENAFARQFYPVYDAEALIVDVRHNHGGNIDSWLLDTLSRKAWGYWQGRATNITTGGLGWDEQFAFRGKIVVLIDEKTSSDGEGFSRGMKTLGLAKLVGTRTWGGGIWLSSDNTLVDGGIATAPEIGTYNNEWGWGLGIEQMGVTPDIFADNDPRQTYDGKDHQLEVGISTLAQMLKEDPPLLPDNPGPHPNRSIPNFGANCPAK